MNSPISDDTLLVHYHKHPGKKIRVIKFLLHISICEVYNHLITESIIHKLKESMYDITGKPLISDTSLHALMPNNDRKITYR